MRRLAGLIANKTTGVDRQVRHIGHYVSRSTSVRATQKATLQDVAASKFVSQRGSIQAVTEHMTISMHPMSKEMVAGAAGEVITMYTTSGARNAPLQWVPSITSASGIRSYINIPVFRTFSGDTLSFHVRTVFWLPYHHLQQISYGSCSPSLLTFFRQPRSEMC